MLDNLFRAWGQTVTIQSQSQTVSAFGDVSSTWSNRSDLNQVKARISGVSTRQRETAQLSGYTVTDQVLIPGYHPEIQLDDRLTTTSVAYDVREINHDSEQSMTKLLVQRVTGPT
jgi:head-tail adaptor